MTGAVPRLTLTRLINLCSRNCKSRSKHHYINPCNNLFCINDLFCITQLILYQFLTYFVLPTYFVVKLPYFVLLGRLMSYQQLTSYVTKRCAEFWQDFRVIQNKSISPLHLDITGWLNKLLYVNSFLLSAGPSLLNSRKSICMADHS